MENAIFLGDFDALYDTSTSAESDFCNLQTKEEEEDVTTKESEICEISIQDLHEMIFTPGEIYWKKRSGKLLKVLNAGEAIDEKNITKFEKNQMKLKIKCFVNMELIDLAVENLKNLKQATNEVERIAIRKTILFWLKNNYWEDDAKGNFLDLTKIGERAFYIFDREMTETLKGMSRSVFERSALVATIGVFCALSLGYTDFKLLQDTYSLSFLLDFAFDKTSYSFNLNKATELERNVPGDGVSFLIIGKDTGPELNSFMQHTFKGARLARERCGKFFNNEEILKYIIVHHERINGNGFPLRINEDEMSDIEMLIIFLNGLIPYNTFKYAKNDGKAFFKKVIYDSEQIGLNESISNRFKKIIINVMENVTT